MRQYRRGSTPRGGLITLYEVAHPLLVPTSTQLSLVTSHSCLHVATVIPWTRALMGQLNQVMVVNGLQTHGELGICLSWHAKSAAADWAKRSRDPVARKVVLWCLVESIGYDKAQKMSWPSTAANEICSHDQFSILLDTTLLS